MAIRTCLTIQSVEESAGKIRGIFDGEAGAAWDIVLANAAAAAFGWAGRWSRLRKGLIWLGLRSRGGKAKETLRRLIAASNAG